MPRLRPRAAAAFALLLTAAPAAAQPPTAMFDLFRQVCMDGQGRLPAGTRRLSTIRSLPTEAKMALQMLRPAYYHDAFNRFATAVSGGRAIDRAAVPNPVYRVGGYENVYLLTPAANPPADTLGAQCILIWEGRDYPDAARAINGWIGVPQGHFQPAIMPQYLGWDDTRVMGQIVTAASLGGWTLMRALPAAEGSTASSEGR